MLGLVAKPVVNLAVRVPPGRTVDDMTSAFTRAAVHGWSEVAAVGGHHASFRVEDGERRAIAHLFPAAEWESAHVRLFADRLRRNPTERNAYAALKRGPVAAGVVGASYTAAKRDLAQTILDRACAERGWPVELPL